MDDVIKYRFTTDLLTLSSRSMKFSIKENFIRFFNSWFVDLRDFTFFIKKYIKNAEQMNLRTYSFDYLGQSQFAQKYTNNPIYGYLSIDFSQDEE